MNEAHTYNTVYTGNDDIPVFISFCIEEYAHEKGISGQEAMTMFAENGILEYLQDYYETLHTESKHWLLKDIDDLIQSPKPIR